MMEECTTRRPVHALDLILRSIWIVAGPTAPCPPPPRHIYRRAGGSMEECITWPPPPPDICYSIQSVAGPMAPCPPPQPILYCDWIQSVPEPAAPCSMPPCNHIRDWIQGVVGPGRHIRLSPFSQSGHSGSSYSSDSDASSSNMSNNSGCSSGSGSAGTVDFFGDSDLLKIAHQLVIDGYTQRAVQEFQDSGTLENWFFDLDVDWVLQICDEHGLRQQLQLQDKSVEDLVLRWIRALVVIVHIIREVGFTLQCHDVTHFGRACVSAMAVFVDAIVHVLKAENLQAMVNMYTCVSRASHYMFTMFVNAPEAQSIFNEIGSLLERQEHMLNEAISSMMEEVRTLVEDDDSWAIEIPRGRGGVHKNTRFMVNCILSTRGHNTGYLRDVTQATLSYLKDLLLRKAELCSDTSMRYLFLLNNSYFVAELTDPCESGHAWKLTPECEKYMDSYLEVSWGHGLSCIQQLYVPGPLHCWINNPSIAKFESAFHKTYQAQKFWRVPDPQLRDALRRAITKRVISGYLDYLKEHQELAIQVTDRSSPNALEKMLALGRAIRRMKAA